MNTVTKGNRLQNRCAKELKSLGWQVWVTTRTKYGANDLWGLFDIAAIKEKMIKFIQVKSNKPDYLQNDRIRALKVPWDCSKEVWIWKDRQGWKKIFF